MNDHCLSIYMTLQFCECKTACNTIDDLLTLLHLIWLRPPFLSLDIRTGFIVEFACPNMYNRLLPDRLTQSESVSGEGVEKRVRGAGFWELVSSWQQTDLSLYESLFLTGGLLGDISRQMRCEPWMGWLKPVWRDQYTELKRDIFY